MFRKYYKEANDDIKPDEAFVNSVIINARRRKPPAIAGYTKYAAVAAAAVVVVSGAVISMPVWNRLDKEEIVFDSVISESEAPHKAQSSPMPSLAPQKSAEIAEERTESIRTSEHSYSTYTSEKAEETTEENTPQQNDYGQEDTALPDDTELKQEVADISEAENAEYSAAAVGAGPKMAASEIKSAKTARTADSDIPAPEGYYCTSASPDGYTFQNDDGAVIVVTISYGGEESAPYYSVDGENIYATVASFGLTVTVNASGADMSTVEEIIESFR